MSYDDDFIRQVDGGIDLVRAVELEVNELASTVDPASPFLIKKLDRRTFLKLSGLASSSLVLASVLPGIGVAEA